MKRSLCTILLLASIFFMASYTATRLSWNSAWVYYDLDGKLIYKKDSQGNQIPDFSMVGYRGGCVPIPSVEIKITVHPVNGDAGATIQDAIDKVSAMPTDINGFRGAVLLAKGHYDLANPININTSGVVIYGEGQDALSGTVITFTSTTQQDFFHIEGKGSITKISGTEQNITQPYVPVGTKSIMVSNTQQFEVGDKIILYRPSTANWIHDIGMDQIANCEEPSCHQWKAEQYGLQYERAITAIDQYTNTISINAPVMMAMETKYGGGSIYKYTYSGRISNVGIENIRFDSRFTSNTDENHGWKAVTINNAEHCWVRNVTSIHYGYSCVSIESGAKSVSILDCSSFDPISEISGSRRYSFNCVGQMNLFSGCFTRGGRHDYVTGSKTCGPNVFTNSTATETLADSGPHHRWATGTLYDHLTCGQLNVQDRGHMGSGHGWAGANHVLWNCTGTSSICQEPPTAHNWNIAWHGDIGNPRFPSSDGLWEGWQKSNISITSLYEAQLKERCGQN